MTVQATRAANDPAPMDHVMSGGPTAIVPARRLLCTAFVASQAYVRRSSDPESIMSELFNDRWAKREAWRKHPIFSMRYYVTHMFPGLTLGVTAFVAYCAWEKFGKKPVAHGSH